MNPEKKEMSFGDHLDALRRVVLLSVIPFVVLIFALWPFWEDVHKVVVDTLLTEYGRSKLARLTAMDTFSLSIKISFYLSTLICMPWIVFQLWMFIRPALYPHERRFGFVAIPLAILLFLGGMAFGLFVMLPTALDFLLSFGSTVVPNDFIGIEYFYSLVFAMMLILGLTFQLPLIVSTAVRFRIIQREHIAKHRRIIIFVSAVLGALLTPTGDPISMGLVAVPIYLLIEGGAVLGTIWKRFADQRASHDPKTIAEGFAEGLGTAGQDKDNNSKGSGGFAESFASSVSGLAKSFGRNIEEGAAEFRRAADEDATQGTVTADDEALPRYQAPVAEPRPAPLVSPVTPQPPVGQPSAPTKPQAPETSETSPERPVPQLPRELRRRIDAYIRERLDQLLDEIGKEQKKDNDGKEEG